MLCIAVAFLPQTCMYKVFIKISFVGVGTRTGHVVTVVIVAKTLNLAGGMEEEVLVEEEMLLVGEMIVVAVTIVEVAGEAVVVKIDIVTAVVALVEIVVAEMIVVSGIYI